MNKKEYFNSMSKEYVEALLKLNRGEEKAFMQRWHRPPMCFMNDLTILREALEKGWAHNPK